MTERSPDHLPLDERSAGQGMSMGELQHLRSYFSGQRIMICFNGPTNQSLIGEIGKALKEHIATTRGEQAIAMDVFSVYIEMSQNIRNYAAAQGYDEESASATVVIAALPSSHYCVSAVNLVEASDGELLLDRVRVLADLGKDELKTLYKQQLRNPGAAPAAFRGAGLGLLEMARRSSLPMQASLEPSDSGRCFFGLKVTV